jgi:hypothetical protein
MMVPLGPQVLYYTGTFGSLSPVLYGLPWSLSVMWNEIVCDVGLESKIKKHILIESLKYTRINTMIHNKGSFAEMQTNEYAGIDLFRPKK